MATIFLNWIIFPKIYATTEHFTIFWHNWPLSASTGHFVTAQLASISLNWAFYNILAQLAFISLNWAFYNGTTGLYQPQLGIL